MEQTESGTFPLWLQQALSLTLTVVAALLYALVVGNAVVKTFVEEQPTFTDGTTRAAGLLSGLVGSVVTAGFSRSKRPATAPVSAKHPLGGRATTPWVSLKKPSRPRIKLQSLGETLGVPTGAPAPSRSESPAEGVGEPPASQGMSAALWVGILYFVVYFLVGLASFAAILLRSSAPEVVVNSAWVWLGTIMSSGYSYFALGSQS